jgi:sodium/potassium-transporting ATPase subunit alpha
MFLGFSGLMWVGAILCFIAFGLEPLGYDNLILAIALLLVVLVTGLFSFIQEGRASKAMQSFSAMVPEFAVVVRDGHALRVNAAELVVGDIVELKGGDKVPADLRIVHAVGFKVDNSSLTGESEPLSRVAESTHQNPLESANIAFFTTFAVEGTATGIVINTGDRSVIGRIAQLVSRVKPIKSPISAEIDRFVNIVTLVAAVVGIVFFGIALAIGYPVLTALIYIIGIAVAQIPSGLPTTVTVAMSLAAKRMARRGVLVKKLTDVATLGSTSVICSDKTGTLTQNIMTVSHCTYTRDGSAEIFSNDPGTAGSYDSADPACGALLRVATLCSRATFLDDSVMRETPRAALTNAALKDWRTIGDASESALLKWTHVCHDIYAYRAEWPKLFEVPFNSTNKYMLSIHQCPSDASLGLGRMKFYSHSHSFHSDTFFSIHSHSIPFRLQVQRARVSLCKNEPLKLRWGQRAARFSNHGGSN